MTGTRSRKLATGTLLTVDNQIDPTTGTVKFKAVFPNKDNELFPNQFVNARLLMDVKHNAVIVPAAAIQRGAQGTFVYVVKADNTVACGRSPRCQPGGRHRDRQRARPRANWSWWRVRSGCGRAARWR